MSLKGFSQLVAVLVPRLSLVSFFVNVAYRMKKEGSFDRASNESKLSDEKRDDL